MARQSPARKRLIAAANELFYRDGIGATGIEAITAHAGVAKMSLYNNFSSKAELVEAYIQARTSAWRALAELKIAAAASPQDSVLAVFDSYIEFLSPTDGQKFRGCGLVNAAAELPTGDPARTLVAAQKHEVEAMFHARLLAIPGINVSDASLAAEHMLFLLEGSTMLAGLDGDGQPVEAARKLAAAIIARLPLTVGLNDDLPGAGVPDCAHVEA